MAVCRESYVANKNVSNRTTLDSKWPPSPVAGRIGGSCARRHNSIVSCSTSPQKCFTDAGPCPANPECSILNSFSPCLIAAYPDENGPTHAGPEEVGHTWTVGIPSICFAGTWNESSRRAWHVRLSSI